MGKFGAYKILKDEKLIIEYHTGRITTLDFIESRRIISSDESYNPDFDLIFDWRDVEMIVTQDDINEFIIFFKKFSKIVGDRKSAYLTSKPNEVIVTTLFSQGIEDSSVKTGTFSTIKGVVNWINNKGLDKNKLMNIIKELKTHPNILGIKAQLSPKKRQ